MVTVTLPDGSVIFDDSELQPNWRARRMFAEGIAVEVIAIELGESLADIRRWISEAPYETPEAYWTRLYHSGVLSDEDE